jgi:hypothetical protein
MSQSLIEEMPVESSPAEAPQMASLLEHYCVVIAEMNVLEARLRETAEKMCLGRQAAAAGSRAIAGSRRS